MDNAPRVETFAWEETGERLLQLAARFGERLAAEPERRAFHCEDDTGSVRLILPLVLPDPAPGESASAYAERLPQELDRHLVLLLQAGAAALGLWRGEELLRHKALKRYVVRGSGKAQPTHLKTRGKSRYGSRLRLQNAARLLEDVNERLIEWWGEVDGFDRVFYSCPVRTWPELFAARPAPPFGQRDPILRRIPIHVHVPDFEELQRVRRRLLRGAVETTDA